MPASLPSLFALWRSTSDFTRQALEVDQLLQLKCMLYSDFLFYNILFISPPVSFLVYHTVFIYHISLNSSWLCVSLILPLFLMILTVLRITAQRYFRMDLNWDASEGFLLIRLREGREQAAAKWPQSRLTPVTLTP